MSIFLLTGNLVTMNSKASLTLLQATASNPRRIKLQHIECKLFSMEYSLSIHHVME